MPERPSNPATDSTLASVPGAPSQAGVGALGPGTIVAGVYLGQKLGNPCDDL